jgi:hypothetical protein
MSQKCPALSWLLFPIGSKMVEKRDKYSNEMEKLCDLFIVVSSFQTTCTFCIYKEH